MGSFFKSKTEVTKSPYEQGPWKPQQQYLTDGFNTAKDAMGKALTTSGALTDYTADMTPEQLATLRAGTDFSMGAAGVGQSLMNSGTYASGALGGYTDNASNLVNSAGADRTGQIIQNAGQFANNPNIQGVIDSSLGDVRKAFDRNVGDINSAASGSGNINSTRAGTLEAYAQDDAMDRAASISSGIRADAWNGGLALASGNISDQYAQSMGANGQLGQAAGMGVDTVNAGYNLGSGAFSNAYGMTSEQQKQAQAEIEGMKAKGMTDMDIVSQYMSTIGASYGNEGYQSSVSKSASPFQQLVGAGTSLLGAFGGMTGG